MDQLFNNISAKGGKVIYDPVEFVNETKIITLAIIGSFITFKLCDCLYTTLYDPIIDIIIDGKESDQYYLKLGKYHVSLHSVFKELIKWIIIIIFLMFLYNVLVRRHT
jgi:hypothetical protein